MFPTKFDYKKNQQFSSLQYMQRRSLLRSEHMVIHHFLIDLWFS